MGSSIADVAEDDAKNAKPTPSLSVLIIVKMMIVIFATWILNGLVSIISNNKFLCHNNYEKGWSPKTGKLLLIFFIIIIVVMVHHQKSSPSSFALETPHLRIEVTVKQTSVTILYPLAPLTSFFQR